MSINITAHQKCLKKVNVNLLKDVDLERKNLLAERRKNRLQQVRDKSNEMARRVRKNVNDEYRKQVISKTVSRDRPSERRQISQPNHYESPIRLPKVRHEEVCDNEQSSEETTNTSKKQQTSTSEMVLGNCSNLSVCSLSTTTSETCETDSNSNPCTICIKNTLTKTKPLVIEIVNCKEKSTPNVKVFEEKFLSSDSIELNDSSTPPCTENISAISRKVNPEKVSQHKVNDKNYEEKSSKENVKLRFNDISDLIKRKEAVSKANVVIPENCSLELNIEPSSKPKSIPISANQPKNDMITFDYNNKYITTNLNKPNAVIKEIGNFPNANFQAQQEVREKFLEDQKKKTINKKIEERGALAMQREQINRDFNELKAKLDIIAKHNSMYDDATVFAKIRPYAVKQRKEKELNKFEELLKLPKLITFPENRDYKDNTKEKINKKSESINIANRKKQDGDETSFESNSSGSILLGFVNKTNKKLNDDLKKNKNNKEKCQQLEKLLEKINEIRDILKTELEKCKKTDDREIKKAMESVALVIKERQDILNGKKSANKKVQTTIIQDNDSNGSEKLNPNILNDFSSSTNYLSPPDRIVTQIDKICNKDQEAEKKKILIEDENKKALTDSELLSYIQRLLGMTRTSINALGLSTSSVSTPNSSTIAIESNRDNNVSKTEEYIKENYEFIEQIRKTLLSSPSNEGISKRISKNWEDSLKNVSTPKQDSSPNDSKINETLKHSSGNNSLNSTKIDKLSENVEQRINELNEMINKVRKEKEKILQSTIPCAFEEDQKDNECEEQKKSILKKNAPITLSRDSGLSSRPTSTQPTEGINPILSTILEIDSPKNLSKFDLQNTTNQSSEGRPNELTLTEQQQLAEVIKTLKDTNKISQTDFVSFTSFLKEADKKSTFDNLIHSLKIMNTSLTSVKEFNNESSKTPDKSNSGTGNSSDSLINIATELNRRNIYLSLPSSNENLANSTQCFNSKQSNSKGSSDQNDRTNYGDDNHINLREFLTRELEKKVNISPISIDSISSSLMRSLMGSITEKQKTSTPMYESSTTDKTINELFSISTVTVNSN